MPVVSIPRSEGRRGRRPFLVFDAERHMFGWCGQCREVQGVRVRGVASAVTCTVSKHAHFADPLEEILSRAIHDAVYGLYLDASPEGARLYPLDAYHVPLLREAAANGAQYAGMRAGAACAEVYVVFRASPVALATPPP